MDFRNHASRLTGLLPGAAVCVYHNTSDRMEPTMDSRDACKGSTVCWARSVLPGKPGLTEVTVGTDPVVIHILQTQLTDDAVGGQVVSAKDVL